MLKYITANLDLRPEPQATGRFEPFKESQLRAKRTQM